MEGCDGLNVSHTLGPSTIRSPAGRALWGGLCGVTLLEEVHDRDRL